MSDSLLNTLVERITGTESLELEFKSAKGGLPISLWPTVSSFANTTGGWIVLGVSETNGEPVVEGVKNPTRLLQEFSDLVRNPQKISQPVCGASDVSCEEEDGKQLVVIRVPAAARKSKPVYISGNPYTGTYLRRQAGDYRCTKPEVDRMMREASDVGADSTVLLRFSVDDLDREALAKYRRRYQTLSPGSPWNGYDDARFLDAIGAHRVDRETSERGITVAGLLLLGTPEAIRAWRGRHVIDFRMVESDEATESGWIDRIVWEGNLFQAFEALYSKVGEGQKIPFRLDGALRLDESPTHVALREALVNLLVHTDYAETQASLIVASPQGYFFRNPGNSRIPESDLLTGDRSDPRNPVLVRMFRLVGLAEEAGTGIPRILKTWKELGFRLPEIDVGTERYEFSIRLRHAHFLSEEDRGWLRTLGRDWDEAEQLALVVTKHEGAIDNLALRRLTGQHPTDATRTLGGLRDRGLLQMSGVGRGARYRLGPASTGDLGPLFEDHSRPSLKGSVSGLQGNETSLQGNEPSLPDNSVASRLEEIARPARNQGRLPASVRDAVIIALCRESPLSVREIARLMDRSEPYIRDAVGSLARSALLALAYPERRTHPLQKYSAPPKSPNVAPA